MESAVSQHKAMTTTTVVPKWHRWLFVILNRRRRHEELGFHRAFRRLFWSMYSELLNFLRPPFKEKAAAWSSYWRFNRLSYSCHRNCWFLLSDSICWKLLYLGAIYKNGNLWQLFVCLCISSRFSRPLSGAGVRFVCSELLQKRIGEGNLWTVRGMNQSLGLPQERFNSTDVLICVLVSSTVRFKLWTDI